MDNINIKERDILNNKRKLLVNYIKGFNKISVFEYPAPSNMAKKMGISFLSMDTLGHLNYNNQIIYIDNGICINISGDVEYQLIEELEKTGKVDAILKFIFPKGMNDS